MTDATMGTVYSLAAISNNGESTVAFVYKTLQDTLGAEAAFTIVQSSAFSVKVSEIVGSMVKSFGEGSKSGKYT